MADLHHYPIIFIVGLVAGVLNVLAEGGSIIALPALIILGYTGLVANGTNRIALFLLNLFALKTFYNRDRNEFNRSVRFAVYAIPGSIIGTYAALSISNDLYISILAVVLILVAMSMYMNPNDDLAPFATKTPRESAVALMMFCVGLYGGFIQAGVGMLLMGALSALFHAENIRKSIHKISIVFAYLFPTSLMLIWTRNVDWIAAVVLLVGYVVGSWCGSLQLVRRYDRLIRVLMVVATVLMALKILQVF